ncbi:MAG: Integral rane protein TerC [Caulobacter sp.]|nr:Integral rane protein TerC [Caulobacter sp.]
MDALLQLASNPASWAALITLVVLEVVLGIDNLVFVAILSNKLPPSMRSRARRIGLTLALVMRVVMLSLIAFIVGMTKPVVTLGLSAPYFALGAHVSPHHLGFSWRDLILIAGGLFLLWKATKEIHHSLDHEPSDDLLDKEKAGAIGMNFAAAIIQIILLDLVFSVDSILTAVGMTNELPIMITAVLIAVALMMVAADPLSNFINKNPTVVMLALGFLLMIGMTLIAEGFGKHVDKAYIYAAMGFAGLVEGLNMATRRKRRKLAEKNLPHHHPHKAQPEP